MKQIHKMLFLRVSCLKKKYNHTDCPVAVGNEIASFISTKGDKPYLLLYSPESMSHRPIENKIWMSDGSPSGCLATCLLLRKRQQLLHIRLIRVIEKPMLAFRDPHLKKIGKAGCIWTSGKKQILVNGPGSKCWWVAIVYEESRMM